MAKILSNNLFVQVLVVGVIMVGHAVCFAEPAESEGLLDMDMEDLMKVPVVVSASRQEQKITETAVPITIVTAEDIHYSGLTTIEDILRFYTGIDVSRSISRNSSTSVGVRGFQGLIADRTQTLIDGRIADNPFFGGTEFRFLPIFVEDIERIEIIRGPGGAAWGANAFTGVINIITKDPEDTLGLFGSTTWNSFGDSYTHIRYGDKKDDWTYRVSAGYESYVSSEQAISDDHFASNDFLRRPIFDIRADNQISEQTKLKIGLAYSGSEWAHSPGFDNSMINNARAFARIEHAFEDGATGHIQLFSNYLNYKAEGIFNMRSSENDIEVQLNFPERDGHRLSVGGNFRATYIADDKVANQVRFGDFIGTPDMEYSAGAFVIDRWQLTDRFWLEGQFRGDWFEEADADFSVRAAAFYSLDDDHDHILRFAFARAYRTPLSVVQRAITRFVLLAPNTYMINNTPNNDLHNEHTYSLEAGYSGRLSDKLSIKVDGYYQRFSNMIGKQLVSMVGPIQNFTYVNGDGADSYGVETELTLKCKTGQLTAWHAYNAVHTDTTNQSIRASLPARHKAGLRYRTFLEDDWIFNVNYLFRADTVTTSGSTSVSRDQSHILDMTISKKVNKNCELAFGISDMFNRTRDREPSISVSTPTPGRMFFGRLQLRF